MGRVAWIGNAVTLKLVLEILLGAPLLVVDNLRLPCCAFAHLCVWMRAALCTSCMVDSYWLTIAF